MRGKSVGHSSKLTSQIPHPASQVDELVRGRVEDPCSFWHDVLFAVVVVRVKGQVDIGLLQPQHVQGRHRQSLLPQ